MAKTSGVSRGQPLHTLAFGDAVDVDRVVAAARRAFEGPWRKWKPAERQAALIRKAELYAVGGRRHDRGRVHRRRQARSRSRRIAHTVAPTVFVGVTDGMRMARER